MGRYDKLIKALKQDQPKGKKPKAPPAPEESQELLEDLPRQIADPSQKRIDDLNVSAYPGQEQNLLRVLDQEDVIKKSEELKGRPREELRQEATRRGLPTEGELSPRPTKDVVKEAEESAIETIRIEDKLATDTNKLREDLDNPSVSMDDIWQQITAIGTVSEKVLAEKWSAGYKLQALQTPKEVGQPRLTIPEAWSEIKERLPKDVPVNSPAVRIWMRDLLKDLEPHETAEFAKNLVTFPEMFKAVMYPFMLSSGRTHIGNVISNIATTLGYPTEKLIGAGLGRTWRSLSGSTVTTPQGNQVPTDQITSGEIYTTYMTLIHKMSEAITFGWKAFKGELAWEKERIDPEFVGPMERREIPEELLGSKIEGQEIDQPEFDRKHPITAQNINNLLTKLHGEPGNRFKKFISPRKIENTPGGNLIARGIDFMGKKLLPIVGDGLFGADVFFKTFGFQMGIIDTAYRQGVDLMQRGVIKPEDLGKSVKSYLDSPNSFQRQKGKDLAEYLTLQTDLEKFGKSMMAAVDSAEFRQIPVGRLLAAFMKTAVNATKYGAERIPGLPILGGHRSGPGKLLYDDLLGNNGPAAQDLAMGKWGLGLIYTSIGALFATGQFMSREKGPDGIERPVGCIITGSGPFGTDPTKRGKKEGYLNVGKRPNSLVCYANDGTVESYSFGNLDPASLLFGVTGDIAHMGPDIIDEFGEQEYGKLVERVLTVMANNFVSKNWAKNLHEFYATLLNPSSHSGRFYDRLVTVLVPRIVNDLKTMTDDQHREFDGAMSGLKGLIETYKAQLPGFSKDLGPRLNIWAEPIMNYGSWGPDMFSPFRYSKEKPDPIDHEAYRLGLSMRNVPRVVDGVRLSWKVRNEWIRRANRLKVSGGEFNGMTIKEELNSLVKSVRYQQKFGSDEERGEYIISRINHFRQDAKKELFETESGMDWLEQAQPGLLERIEKHKQNKAEAQSAISGQEYYDADAVMQFEKQVDYQRSSEQRRLRDLMENNTKPTFGFK